MARQEDKSYFFPIAAYEDLEGNIYDAEGNVVAYRNVQGYYVSAATGTWVIFMGYQVTPIDPRWPQPFPHAFHPPFLPKLPDH